MKNKLRLETGESYTLSDLFSCERRIIIPDLQRDYCWGVDLNEATKKKTDLVAEFLKKLLEYSDNCSGKFNIGIVYGYESPANHIQLCDGQQRITTLFLIVGMINRRLGDNRFSNFLAIETPAEKSLREPYLQYAIRESSLYFLRDLLNYVFIVQNPSKDSSIGETIKQSDWYFRDYDFDPSVQSMIGALVSIEYELSHLDECMLDSLGHFLLDRLSFMYYNLENRSNGEETFVVINTTGEPLSPTENLKPLVIGSLINKGNDGIASEWEEIEAWFWKNRANGNDTADAGFNEFLRWVVILYYSGAITHAEISKDEARVRDIFESEKFEFPVGKISFRDVRKCWGIVKFLSDEWNHRSDFNRNWLSPEGGAAIDDIDCLRLLPIIAWLLKKSEPVSVCGDSRNFLRMHRFIENVARLGNVTRTAKEILCDAISLAVNYDDIVMAERDTDISSTILTSEERRKLHIFSEAGQRRDEIEENFWSVQNDEIFQGEITPLLDWATKNGTFDFDIFQRYVTEFRAVFHPGDKDSLDLLRRALLSYGLTGYPVRSGKNLSFCGKYLQWKQVIFDNSELIRAFLDEHIAGTEFQSIIEKCDPENKWFEIARSGLPLKYCEQKNVQDDSIQGILLIKRKNATTYLQVNLLKETRVRFGADEIDYICNDCIGFHRAIDGRDVFFQRWLNPEPDEVDLYLMSDKNNRNSYIAGSNPNGDNDLERYMCIKIPDTMSAEDITEAMRSLIEKSDAESNSKCSLP